MGKRLLPRIIRRTSELIWWGTTKEGYSLFRDPNTVGGHRWWSDEIGGGVIVWDTSLVSPETLRAVLDIEWQAQEEARTRERTEGGAGGAAKGENAPTTILEPAIAAEETEGFLMEIEEAAKRESWAEGHPIVNRLVRLAPSILARLRETEELRVKLQLTQSEWGKQNDWAFRANKRLLEAKQRLLEALQKSEAEKEELRTKLHDALADAAEKMGRIADLEAFGGPRPFCED